MPHLCVGDVRLIKISTRDRQHLWRKVIADRGTIKGRKNFEHPPGACPHVNEKLNRIAADNIEYPRFDILFR